MKSGLGMSTCCVRTACTTWSTMRTSRWRSNRCNRTSIWPRPRWCTWPMIAAAWTTFRWRWCASRRASRPPSRPRARRMRTRPPLRGCSAGYANSSDNKNDMAKLVISRNDTLLGSRFIEDTRLTIGRASGNVIQLDDPAVSKLHAQVEVVGNDHILLDLGSSNGTFVNGERISRHLLRHGDVVEVSEFKIRYVDHRTVVSGDGDRTMVIDRPVTT